MKNLMLSSLAVFFAFNGFAGDTIDFKQQDFNTQAFELLVKNIDKMKLEGEAKPGEKFKPILDELGNFIANHIFSVMADDTEGYTGPIKNFTADCTPLAELKLAAKCQIIIQYIPMGELGISFYVGLDKNKKPESILENRVYITRGD